jgi:pimeloyl-ACP methyl ester carboxylesterase
MSAKKAILSFTAGTMLLARAQCAPAKTAQGDAHPDYVVLLHGAGRTSLSMKRMEWYLKSRGYRVINHTYHSSSRPVEEVSEHFLADLLSKNATDPQAKIHFVTHSLGGILVREYLSVHSVTNLGRVVMLAPPNHGSGIVDCLNKSPFTSFMLGASRRELGTDCDDLPSRLGAVEFDCGVIAGDRSWNPLTSALLTGPNDGKVTVESAKVDGMSDMLVLHSSHTWIMWREQTLKQTAAFLKGGHFEHNPQN